MLNRTPNFTAAYGGGRVTQGCSFPPGKSKNIPQGPLQGGGGGEPPKNSPPRGGVNEPTPLKNNYITTDLVELVFNFLNAF